MIRIENIVVPVDFSAHSERAIGTALALAKTFGAKLHLVHAYYLPFPLGTPDRIAIPQDFAKALRDSASHKLETVLQRVTGEGIPGEIHLTGSPPVQAIEETAERVGADLIVMGTRGLTGLKHVLLGSVAERTIRTAPCPVMTVKNSSEKL